MPDFEAVRDIVVRQDGRTVFDWHRHSSGQEYRSVASVTKSISSTLVGIAISQNRLSLHDRLADLLPQYRSRMSADVAGVTLEQLLTMTGGFPDTWSDSSIADPDPDWVEATPPANTRPPGRSSPTPTRAST